jgi:hypothetical protein
MRRILLVVTLLASGTACAQTLYKCVSVSTTSYQQAPCPPSARTVRRIEVVPEPPLTDGERAEQAARREQDRTDSEFLSRMAGMDSTAVAYRPSSRRRLSRRASETVRADDRCSAAKATRTAVRRSLGMERNIDLLRKLDGDVADACR